MKFADARIKKLNATLALSHNTFRQNYLKPLETVGFTIKTNPQKPTASNQKYMITAQRKRLITAKAD